MEICMSYQSFAFLLFSAVTLILYYISGRHGQKWVLAAANLFFFVSAGAKYLPYLAVTALVTYLGALCIGRVYKKADEKLASAETQPEKKEIRKKAKSKAKCFLLLSMLVAVGLLAYCKYAGFFTENLNRVLLHFGVPQIETFKTVLPIGISFYTFMALSYILDVYWKRYTAEKNPLTYAVYLSYFPHVVQGPIDRFNEFKEQIKDGVKLSYRNITFGAQLTLWGFFKKLVIADRLGIVVDKVIAGYADYDGIIVILALLLYSIQIYADFSGCIDIVSGISEMFGIKLRRNFNHPYFSRTMAEFWRRWHISLGTFFRDYVYIPLGGNRRHHLRNIIVVWFLTGLWHGASWNFVLWGLFYGALLIFEKKFFLEFLGRIRPLVSEIISRVYVAFITVFGFALFYFTDDTAKSIGYLFGIGVDGFGDIFATSVFVGNLNLLLIGLLFAFPVVPKVSAWATERFGVSYATRRYIMTGVSVLLLLLATVKMIGDTYSPFLYWNF